jgi:cobalt-zinc-cadmium efflux system outer membrane protein
MILFRRAACLLLSASLLPSCGASQAQSGAAPATSPTTDSAARPHIALNDYLNEVLRSNLDLSAQRANIAISQAGVTTATVTPDWSVDIGFPTVDLSNQGNPTNFSAGLNVPIELGGKRGSRVRAAKADVATANSDYEDAVRQLRATATGAFIDALGARAILVSKNKSLGQFDRIVTVNQERLRVGEIGEIELAIARRSRPVQSRRHQRRGGCL